MLDKLRFNLLQARREKDELKISLYSSLLGEALANAELINNEKVVKNEALVLLCKKYLKGIEENLALAKTSDRIDVNKLNIEKDLLEEFLPKPYSKEKLTEVIENYIGNGITSIGSIMNALKRDHFGKFDGKEASIIIKGLT